MTEIVLPCGRILSIDPEDEHHLIGRNWYSAERRLTFYARGRFPGVREGGVYLHRLIMAGQADHRDGNGLNNVRSNLRICTQHQNNFNKTPKAGKRFKGVFLDKRRGTFYAQVVLNRKAYSSPAFANEVDAARWHDVKASELHGEFARLNFPISEAAE